VEAADSVSVPTDRLLSANLEGPEREEEPEGEEESEVPAMSGAPAASEGPVVPEGPSSSRLLTARGKFKVA